MHSSEEHADIRTNWVCRRKGRHLWAYPPSHYQQATITEAERVKVCKRKGCMAKKTVVVVTDETSAAAQQKNEAVFVKTIGKWGDDPLGFYRDSDGVIRPEGHDPLLVGGFHHHVALREA